MNRVKSFYGSDILAFCHPQHSCVEIKELHRTRKFIELRQQIGVCFDIYFIFVLQTVECANALHFKQKARGCMVPLPEIRQRVRIF